MSNLEAYHATAVFGPHRWMIRGADAQGFIGEAQFTSEHDAKTAICVANAIASVAKEELAERIRQMLP